MASISARLSEDGVTLEGVKKMIARQCQQWKGTSQANYLRPKTLFAKEYFDGYYAQKDQPIPPPPSARPGQKVYVKPVHKPPGTVERYD